MVAMHTKKTLFKHIFADKTWLTPSNGLTIARLLLAPVVVWLMYHSCWSLAFVTFVGAAATDMLDGQLARILNEQTHLGTLLDPIADKVLLLSAFGALTFFPVPFFHIPVWFFCALVGREALMIFGSLFLIRHDRVAALKPLLWGKVSTCIQILFIAWLFISYFAGWQPGMVHNGWLVLVTSCTSMSLVQYALVILLPYAPIDN
jgi:cardiolipin synthase